MNVVFVITRSDAMGGASVHVRDMARALRGEGHQATVLVGGTGGEVTERLRAADVPCRLVPQLGKAIRPWRDAAAVMAVREALTELRPDLVSTHTAKAGLVGRMAAASLGLPVLYTPHGWAIEGRVSSLGAPLFRMAEKLAAPMATRIVNVCEEERRLALRCGVGTREQMDVVHNGVPDTPLRARPEAGDPRITMVARFEAPKDHATLIEALATLKDKAWRLNLVGEGPLKARVRELVGRRGLTARVSFHSSDEPVAERLAASQVFVLASRSEGFPRSILEAMRAGLPVVASGAGGAAEAVVEDVTGYIVRCGDVGAMARGLEKLIANAALRERLGAAGRRRYEERFTFERMYQNTLAVYRAALASEARVGLEPAAANTFRRTL